MPTTPTILSRGPIAARVVADLTYCLSCVRGAVGRSLRVLELRAGATCTCCQRPILTVQSTDRGWNLRGALVVHETLRVHGRRETVYRITAPTVRDAYTVPTGTRASVSDHGDVGAARIVAANLTLPAIRHAAERAA